MKKTIIGLITIATLSTSLNATSLFFDRGFNNDFDKLNRLASQMLGSHMVHSGLDRYTYPKLNMSENDKEYKLKFELAGIQKGDIKLTLEDDKLLVLEGEKKRESKDKNSTYFREEIYYGQFKRAIQLPQDADQEKMTTLYKDGILIVTIPKKEVKKSSSKIIKIN